MAWLAVDAGLNGASDSLTRLLELLLEPGSGADSAIQDTLATPTEVAQLAGLVPLLDGLTLMQQQGILSSEEWQEIQQWCERLLARLLQLSEGSLKQQTERALSSWQHLLILALAAFLARAEICCQVIDNLPGLLTLQGLHTGDFCQENAMVMPAEQQLSHAEVWRRLVELCASLGRNLNPKTPCSVHSQGLVPQGQGQRTEPLPCLSRSH
jgi:hypothetical protein